jgi:predicted heme/steroid binding protein
MRKIIAIFAAIALLLALTSCASGTSADNASQNSATQAPATAAATSDATQSGMLELTLEQLKQYDGKNGNPAYVAVDGVIYDVTNVPQWKNGEHNGYSAGNDLTDIIKNKSPHGVKKLEGVPIVGKLVDG